MADLPEPDAETTAILAAAIGRPDVPKIYANGFGLGVSNADVFIVFNRLGPNPVAIVNMSYTLAKTLAQRLGAAVSEFEQMIGGQNILTTDRIDEAVTAAKARKQEKANEPNVH